MFAYLVHEHQSSTGTGKLELSVLHLGQSRTSIDDLQEMARAREDVAEILLVRWRKSEPSRPFTALAEPVNRIYSVFSAPVTRFARNCS